MPDASLVFEDPDPQAAGTHVLVIGVSAYDHLLGGREERPELADGMQQLKSAASSARAVADWFLSEFFNAGKPLRSLALLLSEAAPAPFPHARVGAAVTPPAATIGNVTDAVDYWLTRASTNPENMVIFFFAGHGVSTSDPLLFLQDFGRRVQDRYAGSINLNDFVVAMRTKTPGRQLFLIDSCRTIAKTSLALAGAHRGVALVSPTDVAGTGQSLALQSVHHATTEFAPAFGERAGVSLFTDALLRAFRGGGAQAHIAWKIGTSGLEQALGAYVARAAAGHGVTQLPERSRGSFFEISAPTKIEIPLHVSFDQEDAWGDVHQLEARCGAGVSASWTSDPLQPIIEWSCVVPHREHRVAAVFRQGAAYSHSPEIVMVAPPETVCELKIQSGAGG
ncbi:caspase family protein [Hansschlegelia zhihuaiae]|uniref:Peptidase C14 caspase domain-containing protein n=1 Tax=Hansschlegelia zhihuaiae TaxID=405005 RepID=A0A4Q0MH92_9HYPH|nr:caspase family protein [Hansschlegelia zhihuaiae]RXF72858.1 hypothetical protein EK403_13600 [Hansschlegelia zhihuaiae]